MNDEQLLRYSRHILLPEIGVEGQEKLLASSALVIGAGGLGSPAALYLAAAGVGTITLADGDAVDLTNLQRQILHTTESIGRPKAASGREALGKINPEVKVVPLHRRRAGGGGAEAARGSRRDPEGALADSGRARDAVANGKTRQGSGLPGVLQGDGLSSQQERPLLLP